MKAVKKNEVKLTFAQLVELGAGELIAYAKDTIKTVKAIETAKGKFTENLKFSAKVVAAMKRRYTQLINGKDLPGDTSFKKYFEDNAGGVCPGRIEALASLFNALVETGLLKEEHFDAAKVDWLEKANAIVSAARKVKGDEWKGCDDVLDVLNALSTPGDALTKLKEVRERQKNAENGVTGEGDENADGKARETTLLTFGVAVEFIKAQFAAAAASSKDRQIELCAGLYELNDAWAENDLTENRRNELDNQIQHAREHGIAPGIEIKNGELAPA